MMKRNIFMILLLICGSTVFAQSDKGDIMFSGEMRTRGEMRQGYETVRSHEDKPVGLVSERARMAAAWQHDNLEVKVAAQHVGIWGDTEQKNSSGDISVCEAWAKYSFLGGDAYVQAGRQVLSYDDERILGADDWSASGRHHDALKFVYSHGHHELHLVGACNQNEERSIGDYYQDNTAGYKKMEMAWYHFGARNIGVSALFLNHGVEVGTETRPETRYMQTVGTYITLGREDSRLAADASFYYQFGKDRVNRDTKAYMASGNLYCRPIKDLTLGLGGDFLSGNNTGSMEQNNFNVLYGSYHEFFGAMDYFTNTTIPSQGLIDLKANMKYRFAEKGDVSIRYYAFGMPKIRTYKGVCPGRKLAHEVDLQGAYQLNSNLELRAGYCVIFPLRAMGFLKPGGDTGAWQHWAWLSASIRI